VDRSRIEGYNRTLEIRYSFDTVLMITSPRTTAGIATVISPSEFLPSTLNVGSAEMT
jgi:hypothetical protein